MAYESAWAYRSAWELAYESAWAYRSAWAPAAEGVVAVVAVAEVVPGEGAAVEENQFGQD